MCEFLSESLPGLAETWPAGDASCVKSTESGARDTYDYWLRELVKDMPQTAACLLI